MLKLSHELKASDQNFYPLTDPEIMKKMVIEKQEDLETFWRNSDSAKNSGLTIKNYRCLIFKHTKELRIALGEAEISEKFIRSGKGFTSNRIRLSSLCRFATIVPLY